MFRLECYNFIRLDTDRKEKKEEICNKYLYIFSRLDIDLKERKEEKEGEGKRRKKREVECRIRYSWKISEIDTDTMEVHNRYEKHNWTEHE